MEVKGVNGTVTFDGQTVTITRKGFMARATVGKGTKSIPVHSITAIQWKPAGPITNGFIQFTVGGGVERRSAFGRQTRDAAQDENSVVFRTSHKAEFEELRDAVQAAINSRHAGAHAPQVSSVADELAKLVELRNAGVLSPDEFEAQKARLLG
jgi:Domain of unknown function (DUF4429)/Short C-terminal domain